MDLNTQGSLFVWTKEEEKLLSEQGAAVDGNATVFRTIPPVADNLFIIINRYKKIFRGVFTPFLTELYLFTSFTHNISAPKNPSRIFLASAYAPSSQVYNIAGWVHPPHIRIKL